VLEKSNNDAARRRGLPREKSGTERWTSGWGSNRDVRREYGFREPTRAQQRLVNASEDSHRTRRERQPKPARSLRPALQSTCSSW
jgi:hypothetical protein